MQRTVVGALLALLLIPIGLTGCSQGESPREGPAPAADAWVRPEAVMIEGEASYLVPGDVQRAAVPYGAAVFLENGMSFSVSEGPEAGSGVRVFSFEILNDSGEPIDDTMIPIPALIDPSTGEEQPEHRDPAAGIGTDFIGPIAQGEYAAFSLGYVPRDAGAEYAIRVSLPTGQAVIFESLPG